LNKNPASTYGFGKWLCQTSPAILFARQPFSSQQIKHFFLFPESEWLLEDVEHMQTENVQGYKSNGKTHPAKKIFWTVENTNLNIKRRISLHDEPSRKTAQ